MSDSRPPTDPYALLRRVVAAYDALQEARSEQEKDAPLVRAAQEALGAAIDEARVVANAPKPWRREKRRRTS